MSATTWTSQQIPSQAGKTVLITGANSGIGYQTALELARAGARVWLGVRNPGKGQDALSKLRAQVPGAQVELAEIDVASLASVRAFAEAYTSSGRDLDVLVNNAGVMALPTREVTADGFERQMATNHLGHFALTGLLMPVLLRSADPRVVTVSSLAHRSGKIEVDNLQSERSYSPMGTYGNTKLANLLFARELDRRIREAGGQLRSVAVHPGVARTQIFANGPGSSGLRAMVFGLISPVLFQSEEHGAWPLEYAASMPGVAGGEYIGPDGFMALKGHPAVEQPKPNALDREAGEKLWAVSEQLTGVTYPPLA